TITSSSSSDAQFKTVFVPAESGWMQGWKKMTEPATFVPAFGVVGDTLRGIEYPFTGKTRATDETLPSEALQTYFAPAGESVTITRDGVYKGDWKYEGVRPYLDLSTPLNAFQNLGSIAAGKGASGNYTVADLNPFYFQTDKEMLVKQAEIKSSPMV